LSAAAAIHRRRRARRASLNQRSCRIFPARRIERGLRSETGLTSGNTSSGGARTGRSSRKSRTGCATDKALWHCCIRSWTRAGSAAPAVLGQTQAQAKSSAPAQPLPRNKDSIVFPQPSAAPLAVTILAAVDMPYHRTPIACYFPGISDLLLWGLGA
jgi:hypothetical protein